MAEHFDLLREQHRFNVGRFVTLVVVVILAYVVLLTRLLIVTYFDHEFWLDKRQRRFIVQQNFPTHRQKILDKNNFLLATHLKTLSLGWQPAYYDQLTEDNKFFLSLLLDQDINSLDEALQRPKKFIYLKRKILLSAENLLRLKKIQGVFVFNEDKRFYPLEDHTAQLLGFLNIDNHGAEGVEFAFDHQLHSKPFFRKKLRDPKGRVLMYEDVVYPHQTSLNLSIDSRFQTIIFNGLEHYYKKHKVASFSAILVDAQTAALLAVGSYPSFNPNQNQQYHLGYRLKPFLDSYEPGSTMKPFSVACVLSKHPESINDFHIKTTPGYFMLDGHKITDVTKREEINLIDILLYSSNIGLTRLLQQYTDCDLEGCLKKFGFDSLTEIELFNEVGPYYPAKIKAGSFVEATLSFGYGLQINLAQLARAYTVLANHGVLKPMTLLKDNIVKYQGNQVIESHVADAIKNILQRVVEEGSGKKAYLKDYSIAGKTGTAQRVGLHGYEQRYHAFFAAIFPVEHPRYVLIIHADDPQGQIYGGQICAPLAKDLIPKLLAVSEVPSYARSY